METLLSSAVELMLLGMGSVFVFLLVLIFTTTLMSFLVNRFSEEEVVVSASPIPVKSHEPQNDARLLAVIKEAVKQHRQA